MAKQGLSILIPIYNFSVVKLVEDLLVQFAQANIDFEIRLYDDASSDFFKLQNNSIQYLKGVVYQELPLNLGRSKIRNLLAKDALFENLLFLDCDNEIFKPEYLKNYLEQINNYEVLVGGNAYYPQKPVDSNYQLHWLAGIQREQKPASLRNKNPFASFTLNNMLIKKSIYLNIQLDESITTYGHEDTKFGYQLQKANTKVKHIDNATYHIGLSTNEDFVAKTEMAVKVLCRLIEKDGIGLDTKLYKTYLLTKKLKLAWLVIGLLRKFRKQILKNLKSSNPNLRVFDLYKILIFSEKENTK
jgi:hypothetical protein